MKSASKYLFEYFFAGQILLSKLLFAQQITKINHSKFTEFSDLLSKRNAQKFAEQFAQQFAGQFAQQMVQFAGQMVFCPAK